MPDVAPDDDIQPAAAVSSREPVEPVEPVEPLEPLERGEPAEADGDAEAAEPLTRAGRRAMQAAAARSGTGPSTIAPTHPSVILATVALGLLVVVSAASGQPQTGLALAFVGVVLAWGWPVLLGAPSPSLTALVIGIGAVAIAGTAALTRTEPFLRWVPVAVAVSVIAGFFHQLLRRDGRPRLTHGAATTISGLALAAAGAPLAVLPAYRLGSHYVLAAGAALGLAALVEVTGRRPGWHRWMLVVVVVAGVAGAVGVSAAVDGIPVLAAVILGALVAAVSHALRRVLASLPGADALQARMATGSASVLVVGVVVYLLTRLYAG